jgi:hypothetical protein
MFILYIKILIAFVLALTALVLLWQRRSLTLLFTNRKAPFLTLFWVAFRLVPFVCIYIVLKQMPQSDLLEFFYPLGRALSKGAIPFRDIESAYSPLFGYWMALPVLFWDDPRAVLLLLLLGEGLIVWFTNRVYEYKEPRGDRLFRTLFYYVLPLPFGMSVLSGQEDLLMWGFVIGAIMNMNRPYICGLILGLGLLSTKAILVFIIAPLFFLSKHKTVFTAGICTLCIPVALFMIWKTQWAWLTQPIAEGAFVKAPNLRSLLHPFLPHTVLEINALWKWGGMSIILYLVGWLITHAQRKQWQYYLPLFFVAIYGMMTVVLQNAITTYAFIFMLPLVFSLVDFRRVWWCAGLIGFNVLAAIHPSLWWRLGMPFYDRLSALLKPVALLEYSIEVLLVIGFVYYALQAMNALRRAQPVTQAEPYAV